MQIDSVKQKYEKAKHYSQLAARGLGDVLDALDKALLDQDEDEIDVDGKYINVDQRGEEKVDKSYYIPKKKKRSSIYGRGETYLQKPYAMCLYRNH